MPLSLLLITPYSQLRRWRMTCTKAVVLFHSKFITAILAFVVATPVVAHGQTLTAIWDPNPPSDEVTSYEVCVAIDVIVVQCATATVSATENLFAVQAGVLYYVAIRAASTQVGPVLT